MIMSFMLVDTDYFMNWIKTEAFSQVHDLEVIQFIWKYEIYSLEFRKKVIENGFQFVSIGFQIFCKEWNINMNFSSP